MLANNFKSASDLNIPQSWLDALIKTLVLMETGQLTYVRLDPDEPPMFASNRFTGHFNMDSWRGKHQCGTIACIGGTAEMIGGVDFHADEETDHKVGWSGRSYGLYDLFYPDCSLRKNWNDISVETAAQALRNYLTTGEPNWEGVLGL